MSVKLFLKQFKKLLDTFWMCIRYVSDTKALSW